MDRLQSMQVFRQVAELRSFVKAAEKLGLSTAMVSKHVRRLEEQLGVRLLQRTSRRVSLTPEGQLYLERLGDLLNELEALEAVLSRAAVQPRGLLRIAAPVWLHQRSFGEALAAYRLRYPEVLIDLQLSDRLQDLVEESLDLALRVTSSPHESLIARKLTPMPFRVVASPDYLAKWGRPTSPEQLAKLITEQGMIVNTSVRGWQHLPIKGLNLEVTPVLQTNSTNLVAQAAAAGMGLALLPEVLIAEAPLNTALERVLPDLSLPAELSLYAVYTSRRQQSPKVRSFIDFLVEWYRLS